MCLQKNILFYTCIYKELTGHLGYSLKQSHENQSLVINRVAKYTDSVLNGARV